MKLAKKFRFKGIKGDEMRKANKKGIVMLRNCIENLKYEQDRRVKEKESENTLRGMKNRRKELGLTQKKLAEITGLDLHVVSRLERGQQSVLDTKLYILCVIAASLEISVEELLGEEFDRLMMNERVK